MNAFETLFGVKREQVKKTCILLPIMPKGILKQFGVPELLRGKIYSSGNGARLTLIRTGVGPALAGDAVLYLGDTACKNIILFGSCGLVETGTGLHLGNLLCPSRAYAAESFTRLMEGDGPPWRMYYPDKKMYDQLLDSTDVDITSASCLSIGSLKLQDAMLQTFKKEAIQAVDMECASVFAAAARAGLQAAALFYATDVIGEKPFHAELSSEDKAILKSAIRDAVHILCGFIETKLNA